MHPPGRFFYTWGILPFTKSVSAMTTRARSTLHALTAAVSLALGAATLPQPVVAAAPPAPTVSKAAVKPLQAAQAAVNAKNWDEALAKLKEVEALPTKTPFDLFVMNQFKGIAYVQSGKLAEALPCFEAQLASGFLPAEDVDRISRGVVSLYYQVKRYPEAVEAGQKIISAGKGNGEVWFMVAHSQYFQDKFADVVTTVKAYVAESAQKGSKPEENPLLLLTQSQQQLRSNQGMIDSFKLLVEHYPKASYWRDMLVIMRDTASSKGTTSDVVTLNLYRLMRGTDTLRESNDFLEMAQLAVQLGSPGEAVDALNRGNAADAFKTDAEKNAARGQLATAQKLAETDKAGLAKFEAEAKAAKGGEGDVRLGQALLSYDQPEQALEAMQRGIAKGSLRNADEAQILLGITQLKLGRKADAVASFKAVKGTDPRLGEIAGLWALQAR